MTFKINYIYKTRHSRKFFLAFSLGIINLLFEAWLLEELDLNSFIIITQKYNVRDCVNNYLVNVQSFYELGEDIWATRCFFFINTDITIKQRNILGYPILGHFSTITHTVFNKYTRAVCLFTKLKHFHFSQGKTWKDINTLLIVLHETK